MEAQFKEIAPEIRKLAIEKGIKDIKFEVKFLYEYRHGAILEYPSSILLSGTFPVTHVKEKEEFETIVRKVTEEKQISMFIMLEPAFKGVSFPTIRKATSLLHKEKGELDLAPKPGEVTLFDFWATWCDPCQEPMAHNQEMITEHPEWAGKVRIVGISIDATIDNPEAKVKEKGWNNVDHYWVPGVWQAEICQTMRVDGIPFCVLVDRNGIIQSAGHPAYMALDTNIPLLISGKALGEEEKVAGDGKNPIKDKAYTYEQGREAIAEFTTTHASDIKKLCDFYLAGEFKKEFKDHSFELVESSLVVAYDWTRKTKDISANIKEALNCIFAPRLNIKMQDREMMLGEIKRGIKCHKCSASLGSDDQYLCAICKPEKYFCTKCIDCVTNPTRSSELPHEHGLYLIQKGTTTSLDELKYFNFVMTGSEGTERTHGAVGCDCCHTSPVGIRWKCAICQDVDICEACFKIAKTPTDPQYEETIAKAKAARHDLHEHIYVKVDFSGWIHLYSGN